MNLKLSPAFAVPFGDVQHGDCAQLNHELRALALALEAQGDGYRNPDPVVQQPEGLFESQFEFFARPEACVQALRAHCWAALGQFIGEVNTAPAAAARGLQIGSQTWFHVTRSGGYFGYHNHPMASWSGVYCVADGDPDPAVGNNGSLVFPSPLTLANGYLDVANASLRWPYSQGNLVLNLAPGQLVLFPSWLGHYVTPFTGRAERITVAFNAWFKRDS